MKKAFGIILILVVGIFIWMLAGRQAAAPTETPSSVTDTQNSTSTIPTTSGAVVPATATGQSQSVAPAAPASTPATTPAATPVAAPAASVGIKGYAFTPGTLTVKKGTKVTWTNQDTAKHTVTFETMAVESPFFGAGESYSYTFDKAGTYPYHCAPHPYMKGTVVVTE